MLVMLSFDVPEEKERKIVRKEFLRLGGTRVQYSVYVFSGEPHECDRVIRYMRRVAQGLEGDIRLFPMEESTWNAQIVIAEILETERRLARLAEFVEVW